MIAVPKTVLERIRQHGREAYPEECCGALLGRVRDSVARVSEVEPISNSEKDLRGRRFLITPEDYRSLERLAAEKSQDLLGFYHSHPDHPAAPSEHDREHALPFFHYLVLGVSAGQPGPITSWVLSEDRRVFQRENLVSEN